jgi:hypothetical protein
MLMCMARRAADGRRGLGTPLRATPRPQARRSTSASPASGYTPTGTRSERGRIAASLLEEYRANNWYAHKEARTGSCGSALTSFTAQSAYGSLGAWMARE